MHRSKLLLLLLLPVFCGNLGTLCVPRSAVVPLDTLYGPTSAVLPLNPSNFKSKVLDSKGVVMVSFFAPWCGFSQALAPIWEEVATILKDVVTVASVDCESHKSLAQEYGIRGFPTIKVFTSGKHPEDYPGTREVQQIVEFAVQQVRTIVEARLSGEVTRGSKVKSELSAPVELNSSNFDELVLESKKLWLVLFCSPRSKPCIDFAPDWKNLAATSRWKDNFK